MTICHELKFRNLRLFQVSMRRFFFSVVLVYGFPELLPGHIFQKCSIEVFGLEVGWQGVLIS